MISSLFDDPADQVLKDSEERRRKIMAAGRVGSPGKISTLLGYYNDTRGST
jgi:hypothetical protein